MDLQVDTVSENGSKLPGILDSDFHFIFLFFFNCVCFPFHLPLSDNNLQQQQKASRMSGRIFLIPKDMNILLIV